MSADTPPDYDALVRKYDASVGASTLPPNKPAWKRFHLRFILSELDIILDLDDARNDTTKHWREFEELIEQRGTQSNKGEFWKRKGPFHDVPKGRTRAHRARDRFADYMGDETKLHNWQKLCADLGIDPVPDSITQCKKAAKGVYVNIYDFLDLVKAGLLPKDIEKISFPEVPSLRDYSIKNKKIFPLALAKAEGALRGLLHVFFGRRQQRRGGRMDDLAHALGSLGLSPKKIESE